MSTQNTESILKLALTKGSSPKINQFKDIMHWFKQVLGLALGLIFGIAKMQGILAIIFALILIVAVSILYAQKYLEVEEDEVENSTIILEGIQYALMAFFVSFNFKYS